MKAKLFLLLISALFVISCEKAKYENTGTITGADLTLCACCGGYFIDIEGTQYRFEKTALPSNFTFDDNKLPLTVELDWELVTGGCATFNRITISKIRMK